MQWVQDLYKQTKEVWEENGRDPKGYAIFYSPVKINPLIALIGINPGGTESSFNENDLKVPEQHEYFVDDYSMARKMKKIFEAGDMLKELKESVKFNLIFFRSKEIKDLTNKTLISYSKKKATEIVRQLSPKVIITEGFMVFDQLKVSREQEEFTLYSENRKPLMYVSKAMNEIPLIGLKHPSSKYNPLTDADLVTMGKHLNKLIKYELQLG